ATRDISAEIHQAAASWPTDRFRQPTCRNPPPPPSEWSVRLPVFPAAESGEPVARFGAPADWSDFPEASPALQLQKRADPDSTLALSAKRDWGPARIGVARSRLSRLGKAAALSRSEPAGVQGTKIIKAVGFSGSVFWA